MQTKTLAGLLKRASLPAALALALLGWTLAPAASPAFAQAALPPSANLSVSGSASLPAIGVAPNGRLHALWWDQLDGARYSRGNATPTQTVWSPSVIVPGIAGLRRVDQTTKAVTLAPPGNLQLQVDGAGAAHAVWVDSEGKLLYAQVGAAANAAWSAPAVLATGAAGVATSLDISGTLRIAFIQTSSTAQSPSGVYYLVRAGNAFRRALAFGSTYFRTAKPEEVNMSVASDGGNAVVAWYQAREGGSFTVRTADAGATWSQPEAVVPRGENAGLPVRVVVGTEGPGRFLLMWRDASAPGCGLFQKQSADAGQTWGTPQRVLTTVTRCPEWWQMVHLADAQVALIGAPSTTPTPDVQSGLLAFWNGQAWSQPANVTLLYAEAGGETVRAAGCIDLALAGSQLATIGCDARGDVWANVRVADASSAVQTAAVAWENSQQLTAVSGANAASTVPEAQDVTMAVQSDGTAFAAWALASEAGKPATTLQISTLSSGRWSEPKNIIRAGSLGTAQNTSTVAQTSQPSLALGNDGKLHLVWSGGESGRVFYSAAFIRDALEETRWQTPVMLPAPGPIGGSPQIVANPETGALSVVYTVPFNEGRGVYFTQSADGGATWLTPTQVFDAMAAGWDAVSESRLSFDATESTLHAVWLRTPLPGARGERELFYARSGDEGRTWSQPARVDAGQIEKPQLQVIAPNTVMMVWHKLSPAAPADAPLQVWWQVTSNAGERWTTPTVLAGFEMISGKAGLAADGAGRAYLAALGRGVSGEAALLYGEWGGTLWSKPEASSLNQPAAAGNDVTIAVLNNAQRLQSVMRLSTLRQDGQREFGVAAMSRQVTATPLQVLPTFTPAPPKLDVTETPFLPDNTPEPTLAVVSGAAPAASGSAPSVIVLGAGLALIVLVVGIVASFALSRRR